MGRLETPPIGIGRRDQGPGANAHLNVARGRRAPLRPQVDQRSPTTQHRFPKTHISDFVRSTAGPPCATTNNEPVFPSEPTRRVARGRRAPLRPQVDKCSPTTKYRSRQHLRYDIWMERRKQIRLSNDAYSDPGSVWHLTIATFDRQSSLLAPGFPEIVIESLAFQCRKRETVLLCYCLLPDHLHAAVQLGTGNLVDLVHDFKSFTTNQWRKRTGNPRVWQESFFDRGIRGIEAGQYVARYIVNNPVSAGFVASWDQWPWTGGTLIESGEVWDRPD